MNIRELNDEQAEQLGKTLEAWTEWTAAALSVDGGVRNYGNPALVYAYDETRKLQEMLQPPKQYLVQWRDGSFAIELWPLVELRKCRVDKFKALYEWQDGVGTVGEPITGEPLRELLEGES